MGILYPNRIDWIPCSIHPRTTDLVAAGCEILIVYEKAEDNGNKRIGVTRGRWNGLEWRTDDIGESYAPNIFDPEYGCEPLCWAVVSLPEDVRGRSYA